MNMTSKVLECIVGELRLAASRYPEDSEEYETFYDAADALDDALQLIEDMEQS